jgi:hypothetical protein
MSSVITVAAAMTLPVTMALAAAPARYVEKRQGKVAVALRVSGGDVTRMTIHYRVTCSNGGNAMRSTQLNNLRVNHSGHFAFNGSYIGTQDGSKNHVTLHGQVAHKRATGTFKLTATKGDLRCHSATVHWRAKRVS